MKLKFLSIAIIIALSAQGLFAQTKPDSIAITNNLKQHIKYLASDELQGRETGTIGERKAYEYI
ncbi:MAG TPA: peptidase M28, partial [Bacteroidia bacterium]|nr:peptidase M28 [Bacteroidia bacterium]